MNIGKGALWLARRCKQHPLEPIAALIVALFTGLLLLNGSLFGNNDQSPLVEFYRTTAFENLGVINLVSGIYLGYRAYDTLGETVALILAVTAASFIIRGHAPAGTGAMPTPSNASDKTQSRSCPSKPLKKGHAPAKKQETEQ